MKYTFLILTLLIILVLILSFKIKSKVSFIDINEITQTPSPTSPTSPSDNEITQTPSPSLTSPTSPSDNEITQTPSPSPTSPTSPTNEITQTPSPSPTFPVDCELNQWPSTWSPCNPQTGQKEMSTTVKYYDKNGGNTCPPTTKYTNCPVNCELNQWPSTWSPCNPKTGQKEMSTTIKYYDKNGGNTCPPTTKYTNCPVQCKLEWGNWSLCDENGKQKRTAKIIDYPNFTNTCPPTLEVRDCSCEIIYNDNNWSECIDGVQINIGEKIYSENVGNIINTCPPVPSIIKQDCPVDCILDDMWTYEECDKNTGKRKKSKRVLVNAMNGGLSCPSNLVEKDGYYVYEEEEDCAVNCELGKTSMWSDCDKNTGLQQATRNIIYYPRDGLDENGNYITGNTCPPTTLTRNCDVNCETAPPPLKFGTCDRETGTMKRSTLVSILPKNNGIKCGPTITVNGKSYIEEIKNCKVDCETGNVTSGECDLKTGTRTINRQIKYYPKSGYDEIARTGTGPILDGITCPPLTETETCRVDCDYVRATQVPNQACDSNGMMEYNIIINYPPKNGGNTCPPSPLIEKCPVDSQVIGYTSWSECDKATGIKTRTKITSPPLYGGNVIDILKESVNCKVDCELKPWPTTWSECDKNTGIKTARRDVLYPNRDGLDIYGQNSIGATCPSPGIIPVTLTTTPCKVDCEWTSTNWEKCTDLTTDFYGTGIKGRQRRLNNVNISSKNGGATCPPSIEYSQCDHKGICINGILTGYNSDGTPNCQCDRRFAVNSSDGGKCTKCRNPYFSNYDVGCTEECNKNGTFNDSTGQCVCKTGLNPNDQCKTCLPGYAKAVEGIGCIYSVDTTCNGNATSVSSEGICTCKQGWTSTYEMQCNVCDNAAGYYGKNVNCSYTRESRCNGNGVPNRAGGLCTCDFPYTGDFCENCVANYSKVNGVCKACNGQGEIQNGTCVCYNGIGWDGTKECTTCKPGYGPEGVCNIQCSGNGNIVNGVCNCNSPWTGSMCESVLDDAFNIISGKYIFSYDDPKTLVLDEIHPVQNAFASNAQDIWNNIVNNVKIKCIINNNYGFQISWDRTSYGWAIYYFRRSYKYDDNFIWPYTGPNRPLPTAIYQLKSKW